MLYHRSSRRLHFNDELIWNLKIEPIYTISNVVNVNAKDSSCNNTILIIIQRFGLWIWQA